MKLSTLASTSFLYVCSLERNAGKGLFVQKITNNLRSYIKHSTQFSFQICRHLENFFDRIGCPPPPPPVFFFLYAMNGHQAPAFQKLNITIHRINYYPVISIREKQLRFPVVRYLSRRYRYPPFGQLGSDETLPVVLGLITANLFAIYQLSSHAQRLK